MNDSSPVQVILLGVDLRPKEVYRGARKNLHLPAHGAVLLLSANEMA